MVQSNAPAEIYQLHILLLQINPPIWRRLHVRSDSSIATLYELLQITFDWSDFHLHRFVIRGKEYGLSRIGCTTFRSDAKKALLCQFHFRITERFLYEYDFGDLWQHQIRFEGIEPFREKKLYPVCAGGACASPPEDCGGPEAYSETGKKPGAERAAKLIFGVTMFPPNSLTLASLHGHRRRSNPALPMLRSNVSGQSSQPIKLAYRFAKSLARPD